MTKADWLRSEIEKLEGMTYKEYEYEHTYPCEIGVDMGDGYEKRIEKGQKQTMRYTLSEEEEIHNKALTSIITRYKEELLELEKGV